MQPPPQYEEARQIASGSKDDTAIAMTVPNGSCNGQAPSCKTNGLLKPPEEDNRSDERLMGTEQREDSKDDSNEKKVKIVKLKRAARALAVKPGSTR